MGEQHPITPPPELVEQWIEDGLAARHIATQAARWGADQQLKLDADQIAQSYQAGADQELEACCEALRVRGPASEMIKYLRTSRLPKPPSLKEQAQTELDRLIALIPTEGAMAMAEPIRRALERLPND